ncbi:unnamed protein product [Mesocestoides corti]|uniref:Uncharacterized protein n=1 Tax=Mesocestoides corti TaxID=53468 RepID=A0A0R3UBC2_MESCO|nr:unnamed protein product [Mesocestoides corti]
MLLNGNVVIYAAVSPTYWAKIVLGRGSSALLRILGLATTNLLSFAWFLIFGDISVFKIAVVALALVVVGITYAGYGAYASFIGAIVMGLIAVLSSAVNSLFLRRDPKKSVATVPPRGKFAYYIVELPMQVGRGVGGLRGSTGVCFRDLSHTITEESLGAEYDAPR